MIINLIYIKSIKLPVKSIWSFLLVFMLSSSSYAYHQNTKISINLIDQPLSKILKEIEQQSNYRVVYNSQKINDREKLTVKISDLTLEETLSAVFKNTNIDYVILNNQILLTQSNKNSTTSAIKQETERLITGKVYSTADNMPLAGATVLIKGSSRGAVTNFDGEFTYLVKGNNIPELILEIKYLGMKTLEQRIGNNSEFIIYLEESADQLDQVVITSSYGTKTSKQEIVGSIATLRSEDIAVEQASESIDKIVTGQIAGVLIENTSGVGGPVRIDIRGQGSLTPLGNPNLGTSTQPLIIIDGVIIAESVTIDNNFFDGQGALSEDLSNPLSQISAENIESFTVLKDAAAVSIYGADGANGVILITTKRGKKGAAKYNFSTQIGLSSAINQIKYLNGEQYTQLRNEYLTNTGQQTIDFNGVDTDWFNLLNGTGEFKRYNFNVSGGSNNFTYRASINHLNIDEAQIGNNTKQYNLGINLGYKVNKLNMQLSMSPSFIRKDAPNIYFNFALPPTLSPFNDDGTFALLGIQGLGNPLAAVEQNKNIADTYGLIGSFSVNYNISNALRVYTLFGIDYKTREQDRYFSGLNESGQLNGTFTLDGVTYPAWGRRLLNNRETTKWNWQGQLLYDTQFGEHHSFGAITGMELSEEKTDFGYASGRGFVNPNVINNVEDALQDDNPNTTQDETRSLQNFQQDINYNSRVSAFAQFNYNYKGKYFLLANIRRDESSVFGVDTNVALNGGAGISWILTNEDFLANSSWIDFLKLKLSYGSTGNSRIGSYRSRGLYIVSQNGYNGGISATPSAAPNGNLSWETNNKFNAGVEWNIFKKISLGLDVYHDDIQDLITSRSIPNETGYTSIQLNAASMYNRGIEFSTNIKLFEKENFKWNASFNIATLENKVTDLIGAGSAFSGSERALSQQIGFSTSTIWGVKWAGIDPATGRNLVERQGEIYDAATYTSLFGNTDWVPIGDRQADAFGGFSTTFTFFKQLTLAIRGSYQIGGDFLIQDELVDQYRISVNRNMSVNALDYWSAPGDIAINPLVINNNPIIPNLSKFVYDNTYLKLNNINLNYNIPLKKEQLFIDNLSVFIDATNVAYWYKQKSPVDRNGIREFRFLYPQNRTISLGLNARF